MCFRKDGESGAIYDVARAAIVARVSFSFPPALIPPSSVAPLLPRRPLLPPWTRRGRCASPEANPGDTPPSGAADGESLTPAWETAAAAGRPAGTGVLPAGLTLGRPGAAAEGPLPGGRYRGSGGGGGGGAAARLNSLIFKTIWTGSERAIQIGSSADPISDCLIFNNRFKSGRNRIQSDSNVPSLRLRIDSISISILIQSTIPIQSKRLDQTWLMQHSNRTPTAARWRQNFKPKSPILSSMAIKFVLKSKSISIVRNSHGEQENTSNQINNKSIINRSRNSSASNLITLQNWNWIQPGHISTFTFIFIFQFNSTLY